LGAAMKAETDSVPNRPRGHDTIAISIGATQSTYQALHGLRQSGGCAVGADEADIIRWHGLIASTEGVFVEPSSALSLAAVERLRKSGTIKADERVVCLLTASGLKDTKAAVANSGPPPMVPP